MQTCVSETGVWVVRIGFIFLFSLSGTIRGCHSKGFQKAIIMRLSLLLENVIGKRESSILKTGTKCMVHRHNSRI